MTIKERVDILYDFVETKLEDSGDIIECWSHLEYIEEDLERLEKLEKLIDIFRDKIVIYQFDNVIDNSIFYTLETNYQNKTISKEEYELLREVLRDGRD